MESQKQGHIDREYDRELKTRRIERKRPIQMYGERIEKNIS